MRTSRRHGSRLAGRRQPEARETSSQYSRTCAEAAGKTLRLASRLDRLSLLVVAVCRRVGISCLWVIGPKSRKKKLFGFTLGRGSSEAAQGRGPSSALGSKSAQGGSLFFF